MQNCQLKWNKFLITKKQIIAIQIDRKKKKKLRGSYVTYHPCMKPPLCFCCGGGGCAYWGWTGYCWGWYPCGGGYPAYPGAGYPTAGYDALSPKYTYIQPTH